MYCCACAWHRFAGYSTSHSHWIAALSSQTCYLLAWCVTDWPRFWNWAHWVKWRMPDFACGGSHSDPGTFAGWLASGVDCSIGVCCGCQRVEAPFGSPRFSFAAANGQACYLTIAIGGLVCSCIAAIVVVQACNFTSAVGLVSACVTTDNLRPDHASHAFGFSWMSCCLSLTRCQEYGTPQGWYRSVTTSYNCSQLSFSCWSPEFTQFDSFIVSGSCSSNHYSFSVLPL